MASVDQQHKCLLIKLCDMMDTNSQTYKNFIFFLSASIPRGRLSEVQQNPTDVFALMEERGLLGVGKYQTLEEALQTSGYIQILNVLKTEGKCTPRETRKRRCSDGPIDEEALTVSSVSLEDKFGDLDTECKKMGTKVTKLSRAVVNVQRKVRTQNKRSSLIKKALTDLNQQRIKVRKLDQEMRLRKGSTSQGDVRDIQQSFIKAYESVQIISINPVFDNAVNWKDLDDFYTDIVIEEEKEESAQRMKDEHGINNVIFTNMRHPLYIGGVQQVDKKLTSFRQIFEKDGKKVKRIILKAPAGQGKSTFCRKLVHTWCSVQKERLQVNILSNAGMSNKSKTSGLKDEDEMLRFDVLLYICLRDISDENTLMDTVNTQFPLDESDGLSHNFHIETLITQAGENKVLLILDGLDEMDNSPAFIEKIMQKRLYPHLTVLATTRPWKIGQLSLIRSAHIDLLLYLQGFSFENSMLFAKRIFDKYYKDESAIEQFEHDIWKNDEIRSLIHVPLLLLFIVHVWYEKKSFPQTIHELYLEMLNVMVNRYKERKERKEKSNERQDDKEYLLSKTWPLESMTFIVTPTLRKLSLVKHFGEEFLAALSEVANHVLVTAHGETSLVFDEEALLELLGKDGTSKLQTALNLGIISKSESPGTFRKRICLTFLHKTVQEFLAAINICCREDRCNIFLDSLHTLDDVFKNEQIIKFAAGISTSQCQTIFEKIYEVCDEDRFVLFRKRDLSRIYMDCIREACGEPLNLKLYCIYSNQDDWNVLQSALRNTWHVKIHLKYLCLERCILDDATLNLLVFKCLTMLQLKNMTIMGKLLLSKCTELKSLKLNECTLDDDVLDLSEYDCLNYIGLEHVTMKGKLLVSKCTHLMCLTLEFCNLGDATLDLSESNCLESIRLVHVTMEGKLLLSKCTQLKYLQLNYCRLAGATLDLSESNCLESIRLVHVTMEGKLLLSKCTQLKYLQLNYGNLYDVLDLSESNCLEYIRLTDVTMKGKLLLSKCANLKHLKLNDCRLDDATLDLSESNCLESIRLVHVTMKGKLLLSKCTHLKYLKLNNCTIDDVVLDLSESNCLEYIRLVDVTMKGKLLMSKCTQLKYLKMNNCTLEDVVLDLSESNCLEYIRLVDVTMKGKLLMSKYTQLKYLQLNDCRLADAILDLSESKCLEYLSLKYLTMKVRLLLSKCTQLKYLKLVSCILEVVVFDLSECTCLKEFLCNFVIMTGRGRLLCTQPQMLILVECNLGEFILDLSVSTSLIKQIPQLQNTSTQNADLDDALCSIDNVNNLYELTLHNVTMSKECKKVFFNSLSQCKNLCSLSIKNVDLCDALLSLDSVKNFDDLTLDNVTMSKECKEVFCNSLSQCKKLCELSIKNVDLCDALLSLDSENNLNELTLDNVTMSKECKKVFCNSLSQCKKLLRLSIKNVNQHENVTIGKDSDRLLFENLSYYERLRSLSVENMDLDGALHGFYKQFELDNVTISIASKMMLFVILSQFQSLDSLSLKNLDLSDRMHDMYNMESLTDITIENVKMGTVSKGFMCTSLSQCTQLLILSLKDLDLGDRLLSLKNLERLRSLTMDNVTMCKNGYELMCGGISKCKTLKSLSLKNLDMGDGLLKLDKIGILDSLTIDNVTMCKDGYVILCDGISKCKTLTSLSLKDLDLGDGLDLNNPLILRSLTIDNVTMCKDGYVILCDSISTCKTLTLSLKNLDLGDGLLSLDNLHILDSLTIDNVTMCKDGYVMLCKYISMFKKLRTLSLKNLDLDDAILSLENLCKLHSLTIDNVTMCKDGYVMLCKYISMFNKLRTLSLKNLDLGDAIFNLRNLYWLDPSLDRLDSLTIDNVTMCKDGYVMLCNYISKYKLCTLSLKNMDLGDAIHSLDKLIEFELVNITMSLECADHIKSSVQCLLSSCLNSFEYLPLLETTRSTEMTANSCDKCVVNYTKKRDVVVVDDDDDDDDDDDYYDDDDDDDDDYLCLLNCCDHVVVAKMIKYYSICR